MQRMIPNRPDPIGVLGRLFCLLNRSLPMYLAGSDPWMQPGDQRAIKTLLDIVADQKHYAGRIAAMILEQRGLLDAGDFPMEFTELNMLSLEFLLGAMARYQRQTIVAIEQCVADLTDAPAARLLAEEVLGNARGHLEALEELLKPSGDALKLATP